MARQYTADERALIAEFLIKNFPWLKPSTRDYPSGADQVEILADLYAEFKKPAPKPKAPRFTKDGQMKCPVCGETNEPELQEEGYVVTHNLAGLHVERGKLKAIDARGWPGNSDSLSAEGERLVLMCGSSSCVATFDISDVEVSWQ